MEKIMPNASKEKRTAQARKWYQEDVIEYIKTHPETIKKNIAEKLKKLKANYKLILITTNTKDYIKKILKVSNLEGIYDEIIASKTEQEPNKKELLDELITQYGRPKYYLTGKPDEKINNVLKELGVKIINVKEINKIK